MRLLRCPKPHVLLVHMSTQIKMGFITEQNQAKIMWVVLSSFTDSLIKFALFLLIDISMFFGEFALSMGTSLSHCEWFFVQSIYLWNAVDKWNIIFKCNAFVSFCIILKCRLPETVIGCVDFRRNCSEMFLYCLNISTCLQ